MLDLKLHITLHLLVSSLIYSYVLIHQYLHSMHVMSGPEAAREMRKIGYLGPIIGVTGDADTEEFLASGADMVLQKKNLLVTLSSTLLCQAICFMFCDDDFRISSVDLFNP